MKLNEQEIEKKIIDVLCSSLALLPGQIKRNSRLITDLGMDSLDFLDIMFSLESVFKTKIKDSNLTACCGRTNPKPSFEKSI